VRSCHDDEPDGRAAGYFKAFDIPIVRGRDFDTGEYAHSADDAARAPSFDRVIIGSDLARRLWGDANPLGRRLAMATSQRSGSAALVVVGVVDETAAGPSDLNERIRVYVPYSSMNTGVIARTAGPALPVLNAMRKVAAAEAPQTGCPIRPTASLTRAPAPSILPFSAPDRAPPTRGQGSIPTCRGLKRGAGHLLSA
jgi:hypothetical protein